MDVKNSASENGGEIEKHSGEHFNLSECMGKHKQKVGRNVSIYCSFSEVLQENTKHVSRIYSKVDSCYRFLG